MLLKERLQSGYLSVDAGYVLFNNVGQFLNEWRRMHEHWNTICMGRTRTLISTGRSSNNVFRFATRKEQLTTDGSRQRQLTVRELSELDSGAAYVFADGRGHSRKVGLGSTFGMTLEQVLFRLCGSWW